MQFLIDYKLGAFVGKSARCFCEAAAVVGGIGSLLLLYYSYG